MSTHPEDPKTRSPDWSVPDDHDKHEDHEDHEFHEDSLGILPDHGEQTGHETTWSEPPPKVKKE